MLRVFTTKPNGEEIFPFEWDINDIKMTSLSPLQKLKNRYEMPEYHKVPTYPEPYRYNAELKRGYTTQFELEFNTFVKYQPDMRKLLKELIRQIQENPTPKELFGYKVQRKGYNYCWEILNIYTRSFRRYLSNNNIKYKEAYVISLAVGTNSLILNKPFELSRPNNYRIIYETVDNKVLLTNINYHKYRDSLYSNVSLAEQPMIDVSKV